MEWAKNKKKTGLLLLIDVKKAYDSISFKFIGNTLLYFGFGNNYIKWINILLNNFKACINHVGNISGLFDITRGCRQGDPIAAALFVLSIEILCIKMRTDQNIKGYKLDTLETLLSLYADDCSIFLEYDSNNLENTITILDEFYKVSGLQIHLNKTQCVIFGLIPNGEYKLCNHISIFWEQNFKLLGIQFDGLLENMDVNYYDKLREIRAIMKNWQYRFISPLGRACIAKTLLLSKLSHLAFVLPGINKKKLKEIENEIYTFIWGGQEKVARGDAKQPESRGGLGFPDISSSWTSFKFSWFRRLVHSHSAWKDIFSLNIEENFNLNLEDFCSNVGTVDYDKMSKKLSNPFWSECLRSIKPLMLEHLKNAPENLTSYPIWGSNVFIMNSAICSKRNFGNVGRLVRYPADILIETVNGTRFMLEDEFSNKFNEPPDLFSFISMKHVIRSALLRLGVTVESLPLIYPILPPMLNLISYSSKGCNKWSKLLKSLEYSNSNLLLRERKWEEELEAVQGIHFWEKCYELNKNLFFDNRLKWFQYQVTRGTLKTNRIISKFINNVSENCTFCGIHVESISHLLYDCTLVRSFISEVYDFFIQIWAGICMVPSKKDFIFGERNLPVHSPNNLLALYTKLFIWRFRCLKKTLTINAFYSWFKNEIYINKMAFEKDKRLNYLNEDSFNLDLQAHP